MSEKQTMNVIAIPFAGGDRYSYRSFQTFLGNHITWHTLELPGRGMRRKEALAESIEEMVERLFEQVTPIIESGPFVLYGHSMGAILGYQLILELDKKNIGQPVFAFFTGAGAPGYKPRIPIAHLESHIFWQRIAAHNGVPDVILNNEELKHYFEPAMRKDFAALELYFNTFKGYFQMSCPLYVGTGADESITGAEIAAWQNFSRLPVEYKIYTGDHFAYIKEPIALCKEINDLCHRLK